MAEGLAFAMGIFAAISIVIFGTVVLGIALILAIKLALWIDNKKLEWLCRRKEKEGGE